MTRILLLGASGFLGRHVRAALEPHARLTCPTRHEVDLVDADVATLTGLLADLRPDAVVNCAGRVSGGPTALTRAHTEVTAKLIEAVAAGAPRARLVRLGSAAEYGRVPYGHAVREDDPAHPVGEYGVSHAAGTRLAELAGAAGRVDSVVLRVFNPVGPGLPAANVLGQVGRLVRRAMTTGERSVALGLVRSYRDFVDVRDVASAVVAALHAPVLRHRVFNVGRGRAVTTRYAVESLAQAAGFTGTFVDGALSASASRSAGVPWMCADVSRAAEELGWVPEHELADSVKALWAELDVPARPG